MTQTAIAHFLANIDPPQIVIMTLPEGPRSEEIESCPLWDVESVDDVDRNTPIYTKTGEGPRWLALDSVKRVGLNHWTVHVERA